MGISGLCDFLRKKVPGIIIDIPISCLSGDRLAVDTSVYLYKFICMENQHKGKWLDMFIHFIIWLRQNNIRPIFVFDGKAPQQKERTRQERREIRKKTEEKVNDLDEISDLLDDLELNDPLPKDVETRIEKYFDDFHWWSRKELKIKVHEMYKRENGKCINIGPAENKKVQDLLTYMGIPWFKAVTEAEKTCSWLCKWGYVKGVITTDSDVLAYGCPQFIRNIAIGQDSCQVIFHSDILSYFDLTYEQFRDFCIMCGTDYNKRIKGLGPVKALQLIGDYGNLEEISKDYDTEILHYEDTRSLFTLPSEEDVDLVIQDVKNKEKFKVPSFKKSDMKELALFLMKNNSRFAVEELQGYAYRASFVVED